MHFFDNFRAVMVPINSEGYPYIAAFAIASLILGAFVEPLGWMGAVLTVWCIYFFRDPERIVPEGESLVVSPADGVLLAPVEVVPPPELNLGDTPRTRLSIFMNVFDVHVNRAPVSGTVTASHYIPGLFVNASLDKASEDNERQLLTFTTSDNVDIGVVQIAGLVARRIVCNVRVGETIEVGNRFGMIRFGSRVDIYLPSGVASHVIEGQKMVAGETILADLTDKGTSRAGRRV